MSSVRKIGAYVESNKLPEEFFKVTADGLAYAYVTHFELNRSRKAFIEFHNSLKP